MSFPSLTDSDTRDPDFQDSLIVTIAETTEVNASSISIQGRRTASVSAQIQAASASVAASASSAVTSSVSSGAFTTSLNSALASTSYSGAIVTAPTAIVTTSSSSSSSSSSEFYEETWFLGVCAGVGLLLLVATVAAIAFVKRRSNKSLKEFDNVGVGGHTRHEASGIVIHAGTPTSSPRHTSSLLMKSEEQPDWDNRNSFVGNQDEIGLDTEVEMSDHMMRESFDAPAATFHMRSEDVDLNEMQGKDAFSKVDLSPRNNSTRE